MNILQANFLGNVVEKFPKNILLILGSISVLTTNILAKNMGNIEQKNYKTKINSKKINVKNDGHLTKKEREIVIKYLEEPNNFTKNAIGKLKNEIYGEYYAKLKNQLLKYKRNFKYLQLVLREKGYYNGEINYNFSEELLKALIAFQKDNNIEPGLLGTTTAEKLFFEKYVKMIEKIAQEEGVYEKALVKLVKHENQFFQRAPKTPNKKIVAKFVQMTDDDWKKYGKGLELTKIEDQIRAAARKLKKTYEISGNWGMALALYNTGENFHKIKRIETIKKYVEQNPGIKAKIPKEKLDLLTKNINLAKKIYLIAAVAFYSDINYDVAKYFVNNWTSEKFRRKMRFI